MNDNDLPLSGLRVLDFAQFLAGPMAALRLADLGAEVIKVERPKGGDLCRGLVVADQTFGDDSLLFHTINRNKRSLAADLKVEADLYMVKSLIEKSDVMIHNFRPSVMERIGLGYDSVRAINPRLVYGAVTGYGNSGPWKNKPGQDLLVQSLTGMPWLSGNRDDGPVPVSFAVLDMATGNHLVQGILAALVRRGISNSGSLVEVDLMSSAVDAQFEQLTSFFNSDRKQPPRSAIANASVHGAAPYGIYQTSDGYLAIAMTPIARLSELLNCDALTPYGDPSIAFTQRDEIKSILADFLKTGSTRKWLDKLEPADIWCAEVLDWPHLLETEGFAALDAIQEVVSDDGEKMLTTRCPIRINGHVLKSTRGAPALGEFSPD